MQQSYNTHWKSKEQEEKSNRLLQGDKQEALSVQALAHIAHNIFKHVNDEEILLYAF